MTNANPLDILTEQIVNDLIKGLKTLRQQAYDEGYQAALNDNSESDPQ